MSRDDKHVMTRRLPQATRQRLLAAAIALFILAVIGAACFPLLQGIGGGFSGGFVRGLLIGMMAAACIGGGILLGMAMTTTDSRDRQPETSWLPSRDGTR